MLKFLYFSFVYSKARTLFEKNAAPILHLSGMDVTVVKVRTLQSVDFFRATASYNLPSSLDSIAEIT